MVAARQSFEICQALMDKGKPCEALKKCHKALDVITTAAVLELTRETQQACRLRLPKTVPDTDADGLPDPTDKCPKMAEDADGYQDEDGCPDTDNDIDGVPDIVDSCPMEGEDVDGFQDADGCPDLDNDADGIPDEADRCPLSAEDQDDFMDDDGCPELDNDGDNVVDSKDACPNEPEDFDGTDDLDGCPELDNDNDGIPDTQDVCPNRAEDIDGVEDVDGCPDLDISTPVWIWTLIGTGSVIATAGLVLEAVSIGERVAVIQPDTQDGRVEVMTQRGAAERLDQADLMQVIAFAGIGLGAGVLLTGVVFWALQEPPAETEVSLVPSRDGWSVTLRTRF